MPRKKRPKFVPGKLYHIYNRGNKKDRIYYDSKDRTIFHKKVHKYTQKEGTEIIIECLMDNHYHLILKQGTNDTISKIMQRVGTSYSRWFNERYNNVGHVFQGRFKSRPIKNQDDLKRLIHYVRMNPVKSYYVDDPEHYKWLFINSSYVKGKDNQT